MERGASKVGDLPEVLALPDASDLMFRDTSSPFPALDFFFNHILHYAQPLRTSIFVLIMHESARNAEQILPQHFGSHYSMAVTTQVTSVEPAMLILIRR